MAMLRLVKRAILKSRIPPSPRMEFGNALLAYGQWLREHPAQEHYATRDALYAAIARGIGDVAFDFLEAGVYKGESLRSWTRLSQNKGTRFFGFDTFTGLPGAWQTGLKTFPAGHFNAGGQPPDIQDARVQFVSGRFQDTLPAFLQSYSSSAQLVVHLDADMYSSTLFFLTCLHERLVTGTYLLFDNFSVATHDFRAFRDYTNAYDRTYEVVATAEPDYEKVAMRLI